MRKFLIIIFVFAVTACQGQVVAENSAEPEEVNVEVTRAVAPAPPSPTPVVCTSLPDDMTLDVEAISESEVAVRLNGLQSGESLSFIFVSEIPGQRRSAIESFPVDKVAEDGQFEFNQVGLRRLDEAVTNTWEVKVVHARGVACTEITLPEP